MNGFNRICAAIAGAVLFVAGMLKLMDPLGTRLIVEEYLKFFHLNFLIFGSGAIGIVLALLESAIGAAMTTGIWRMTTAIASLCVLCFFTIITLVLWIAKPAMDCGCFGELIHLEHWQSFAKNIILLLLWACAYLPLNRLGEPQRVKYISFAIAMASVALFSLYSLLALPLVDFTSLKPGTELNGAYDQNFDDITSYIYEKDGREGAFDKDCPPDSSWTFVRAQEYDRGFFEDNAETRILSFSNAAGEYSDSLATKGNLFVISAYDPLSSRKLRSLADFAAMAEEMGYNVLFLVGTTPEELAESVTEPVLLANSYFADRRELMTLNRSNGGVTYISAGQVTAKWASNTLPNREDLTNLFHDDPVEYMMNRDRKGKIRLQGLLLYTFAVMLLL